MPYQSANASNRPLRVFLCHSSADKLAVRELYQKLRAKPWIQPWLDEEAFSYKYFIGKIMSFYIRRSVRFGPVRFNFSKSGVGVSLGIKGARLSTGPRGTYINMGGQGVYYRQKINDSIDSPTNSQSDNFEGYDFRRIEQPQVYVANLVESSSKELLDKMNSRIRQPRYAFLVGIIATIIASGIALFGLVVQNFQVTIRFVWIFFFGIAGLFWLLGLWVAWVTSQQEKYAQITTLRYSLDESANERFVTLQKSLEDLSKSNRIWLLTSRVSTFDWKRNAGASSLISRRPVVIRQMQPPFVGTQIKTFTLTSNLFQLFFMPDQILVFQHATDRNLRPHRHPLRRR
jgi:hypothetical protein